MLSAETSIRLPSFDMGRRRGQRQGFVRIHHGSWLLTYRAYDAAGKGHRETVRIGPAEGKGKLSRKQAERFAWDHYLSKIDETVRQPRSMVTAGEFWEKEYKPNAPMFLKKLTCDQYFSLYQNWIEPVMGAKRLSQIEPGDVERAMAQALSEGMSRQSARHIRKVISAIWSHAKKNRLVSGDNPAILAQAPEVIPVRPKIALSFDEMQSVLGMLPAQERVMAFTAVITSANISELCGLRWKHLNLTPEWVTAGEDGLAPFTIAIRQHFTRGEIGTLKTGSRRRNIPIPRPLVSALARLKQRAEFTDSEDVVFASRRGTPVNENNIRRRLFPKIAKTLGLSRLSWHVFRYSHATFTEAIGMHARDRQALMGHGSLEMTDRYTLEDQERMRQGLEQIADRLLRAKGTIQ